MTHAVIGRQKTGTTLFVVLCVISFCHFVNDLAQSLLPAIYPIVKTKFSLTFGQIGMLTLVSQGIASLLQPVVGLYTDRKHQPYSLSFGMGCTLLGLLAFAFAPNFPVLLVGAAILGLGSAIFHPESSRLARFVSGGAHGFAQSLFQVGGNFGG
ncbi:MAG: MFS transporter, partial [Hyphomicrobiales bacterium]|nr:MFS transporter [Hyphomicrobiales bacterium]